MFIISQWPKDHWWRAYWKLIMLWCRSRNNGSLTSVYDKFCHLVMHTEFFLGTSLWAIKNCSSGSFGSLEHVTQYTSRQNNNIFFLTNTSELITMYLYSATTRTICVSITYRRILLLLNLRTGNYSRKILVFS